MMKHFKRASLIFLLVLSLALLLSASMAAQNKVVVLPLLDDDATGNATEEDVLNGKTFSNSTATGLTGTRSPASVPQTGQAASFRTGDDGHYEKGEPWPVPRFTAGTFVVTDHLTGLMWQKSPAIGILQWDGAIDDCNDLVIYEPTGGPYSHHYNDWRLPNRFELESLLDLGTFDPALPSGNPFTSVQSGYYWSSSADFTAGIDKWRIDFYVGNVDIQFKDHSNYRWCVRDGN